MSLGNLSVSKKLVLAFTVTVVIIRYSRRWVHYAGGAK